MVKIVNLARKISKFFKKFIQITLQSNFKLQFEEIIISLKFCPRCAGTQGFFRDIFATHFVGFPFSFFLELSFIFFTTSRK